MKQALYYAPSFGFSQSTYQKSVRFKGNRLDPPTIFGAACPKWLILMERRSVTTSKKRGGSKRLFSKWCGKLFMLFTWDSLPIAIPLTICMIESQCQHMLGMVWSPPSAWALHALLNNVAVCAFNLSSSLSDWHWFSWMGFEEIHIGLYWKPVIDLYKINKLAKSKTGLST